MISLENKELKNQNGLKLCKMHKMKRPHMCRNGKVRLNMTKAETSSNFKVFRKRPHVDDGPKNIAAKKGR